MAEIGAFERRKLEKLLGMGEGYVLNFSDRTYAEFFLDFRVDIDAAQFRVGGDSKAKRMRTFWEIAPNHTVGKVLDGLIAYGVQIDRLGDSNPYNQKTLIAGLFLRHSSARLTSTSRSVVILSISARASARSRSSKKSS